MTRWIDIAVQKTSAKDAIGIPGGGLVEIRWVFVHDLTGTHRDDYFFTTDRSLRASEIIEIFTGRWSIETMFQEMRAYLGL